MPYLVRRLLENGSNTSFVNRIVDASIDVSEIVADPLETTKKHGFTAHPKIAQPADLFVPERRNSAGLNLADRLTTRQLLGSKMLSSTA